MSKKEKLAADLRHRLRHAYSHSGGFRTAIEFAFQTARARLFLVSHEEHFMYNRHSMVQRDAHERISDRRSNQGGVGGLPFDDHSKCYYRIVTDEPRNLFRRQWNLEGSGNVEKVGHRTGRDDVNLPAEVVYESIH
jgi:hypothetical protein